MFVQNVLRLEHEAAHRAQRVRVRGLDSAPGPEVRRRKTGFINNPNMRMWSKGRTPKLGLVPQDLGLVPQDLGLVPQDLGLVQMLMLVLQN
ncbi:hypothetical protein EYF80_065757 [Liparis tanakae]|uniref:Uncharacterized protein n=1 Tax=Liparis tanakae TaxID=230148 RepID=A0A4Z2E699_9TELE|nr:hypothetical protein EYF80_065757 [Liparis tanakae]